jgi:hypothetical protein
MAGVSNSAIAAEVLSAISSNELFTREKVEQELGCLLTSLQGLQSSDTPKEPARADVEKLKRFFEELHRQADAKRYATDQGRIAGGA